MILARAELRELTSRASRRLMCKELDAMGIHYELGIDGWPRVLREHMQSVLSGQTVRRKTRPTYGQEA